MYKIVLGPFLALRAARGRVSVDPASRGYLRIAFVSAFAFTRTQAATILRLVLRVLGLVCRVYGSVSSCRVLHIVFGEG